MSTCGFELPEALKKKKKFNEKVLFPRIDQIPLSPSSHWRASATTAAITQINGMTFRMQAKEKENRALKMPTKPAMINKQRNHIGGGAKSNRITRLENNVSRWLSCLCFYSLGSPQDEIKAGRALCHNPDHYHRRFNEFNLSSISAVGAVMSNFNFSEGDIYISASIVCAREGTVPPLRHTLPISTH